MSEDNRRTHRHLSELPVWVIAEDEQQYQSIIKDMSLLGCSIDKIDLQFENNTTLYLYLDDPQGIAEKCEISKSVIVASPVYQDGQSIGLSFTSVGTDVLNILQEHLVKAKYF